MTAYKRIRDKMISGGSRIPMVLKIFLLLLLLLFQYSGDIGSSSRPSKRREEDNEATETDTRPER